jgi:hypothetical protein
MPLRVGRRRELLQLAGVRIGPRTLPVAHPQVLRWVEAKQAEWTPMVPLLHQVSPRLVELVP